MVHLSLCKTSKEWGYVVFRNQQPDYMGFEPLSEKNVSGPQKCIQYLKETVGVDPLQLESCTICIEAKSDDYHSKNSVLSAFKLFQSARARGRMKEWLRDNGFYPKRIRVAEPNLCLSSYLSTEVKGAAKAIMVFDQSVHSLSGGWDVRKSGATRFFTSFQYEALNNLVLALMKYCGIGERGCRASIVEMSDYGEPVYKQTLKKLFFYPSPSKPILMEDQLSDVEDIVEFFEECFLAKSRDRSQPMGTLQLDLCASLMSVLKDFNRYWAELIKKRGMDEEILFVGDSAITPLLMYQFRDQSNFVVRDEKGMRLSMALAVGGLSLHKAREKAIAGNIPPRAWFQEASLEQEDQQ